MAGCLKLGNATMPWNTWPTSAARYGAGTEMRPFRSILLMKVSMNTAIDCAFASRDRLQELRLGTRPLMAGAAIVTPRNPGPTRPSELGIAVSVMGYHGIRWASMGIGRNTLENLG